MANVATPSRLELLDPWDAWHAAAHRGRLLSSDGTSRDVMVILGPVEASTGALDRARAAAAVAMGLRGAGVVQLLEVTRVEGRVAWVYEAIDGISLSHVVGANAPEMLSTCAAAEVVASVSHTLRELGRQGLMHPGPEPTDLLLDESGRVRIFGFAGPSARAPSMHVPQDDGGEPATVYRLGVLLAHLVSGTPPASASEERAHGTLIRRALIRAMTRSGPVLSERYGDWIRGMLSWVPAERPPLSAVPEGLRQVATNAGGHDAAEWSGAHVPALVERVNRVAIALREVGEADEDTSSISLTVEMRGAFVDGPPPRRKPAAESAPRGASPPTTPGRRVASMDDTLSLTPDELPTTLGVLVSNEHVDDDVTQEALSLAGSRGDPLRAPLPPRAGALAMPVEVGPPPELVKRAPRLPRGFLENSGWEDDVSMPLTTEEPPRWGWVMPAVWSAIMLGLVLIVAVLGAYLLFGGSSPVVAPTSPGPSLRDALAPATPSGQHSVR